MDCKEFERKIPDFMDDSLEEKELNQFLAHMDSCEDCKEELSIQILVLEGVSRLEEGDAFDLQNEIEKRIEDARSKQRMHHFLVRFAVTMLFVGILAAAIFVLLYFGLDI